MQELQDPWILRSGLGLISHGRQEQQRKERGDRGETVAGYVERNLPVKNALAKKCITVQLGSTIRIMNDLWNTRKVALLYIRDKWTAW